MPYVKKADYDDLLRDATYARALAASELGGENAGLGIENIGRAGGATGGASFNTGAGTMGGMRAAYRIIGREGGRAALNELGL